MPQPGCARVPAVEILRRVWVQQFTVTDGQVSWHSDENIPPASRLIASLYDPEAHMSIKRSTVWTGDIGACDRNL
jgi:transposase